MKIESADAYDLFGSAVLATDFELRHGRA